jgi:hypothetical protein
MRIHPISLTLVKFILRNGKLKWKWIKKFGVLLCQRCLWYIFPGLFYLWGCHISISLTVSSLKSPTRTLAHLSTGPPTTMSNSSATCKSCQSVWKVCLLKENINQQVDILHYGNTRPFMSSTSIYYTIVLGWGNKDETNLDSFFEEGRQQTRYKAIERKKCLMFIEHLHFANCSLRNFPTNLPNSS